ncbi:MAG: hypothetical protein HZC14_03635 [Candidatus Niyogibacteria bacterium]|nr:hypothetical protein [Candidatus Niyogibacteria bacterium]
MKTLMITLVAVLLFCNSAFAGVLSGVSIYVTQDNRRVAFSFSMTNMADDVVLDRFNGVVLKLRTEFMQKFGRVGEERFNYSMTDVSQLATHVKVMEKLSEGRGGMKACVDISGKQEHPCFDVNGKNYVEVAEKIYRFTVDTDL